MSAEQNKTLFRRFMEEAVNKGNLAAVDELISPDFVEHEELPPGTPPGREGVKAFVTVFRTAFPDLKATLSHLMAEDDMVVGRGTWTATHRGEFMGIPPTGKRVSFAVFDIVRIVDGKAVEHWGTTDTMAMMQQLGVVPAPEQG